MKRHLIIFLLAIILFSILGVRFVKAWDPTFTCFPPLEKDTIFKLTDLRNAHLTNYDQSAGANGKSVCFSEYFGGSNSWGNPHLPGNNAVINLSTNENAHAGNLTGTTNYPYAIRYGDFVCDIRSKFVSCKNFDSYPGLEGVDGTQVVYLSSKDENAHVEFASSDSPYLYKLCCASGTSTQWPYCNYNGVCENGKGGALENYENETNCEDCIQFTCGNGIIDTNRGEDCDCGYTAGIWTCEPEDLNNKQCTDFEFDSGELGCNPPTGNNPCRYDYSKCTDENTEEAWCLKWEPTGGWTYTSSGLTRDIAMCMDYNNGDVKNDDGLSWRDDGTHVSPFSSPYDKEFRALSCNYDCAGVASSDDSGPVEAENKDCDWNPYDDSGNCQLSYTIQGTQCRISNVGESQCDSETNTRTVTIKVENLGAGAWDDCGVCPTDSAGADEKVAQCTLDVPCPRALQLPFFGWAQFFASAIIISIIYFAYLSRKK